MLMLLKREILWSKQGLPTFKKSNFKKSELIWCFLKKFLERLTPNSTFKRENV